MRHAAAAALVALGLLGGGSGPAAGEAGPAAASPPDPSGVSLSARGGGAPRAGEAARLEAALADPVTGYPLAGLHLRAWLRPARPGRTPCVEAAARYLRGTASPRSEIALDGFDLLALDDAGGLARVEPSLGLATANIARLERLGGARPSDLLLDRDAGVLALAAGDGVELRDALTLARLASVALPAGAGPARLVAAGAGRAWAALDGAGAVAAIDLAAAATAGPAVPVGPGPLAVAHDPAGGWLLAGAADGRLVALDAASGAAAGEARLDGGGVTALAVLPRAGVAYAALADRRLEARSVPDLALAGQVALPFAARRLAATPDGRWLLALEPTTGALAVVDAAAGRVAHLLALHGLPDQVVVDDTLAWFRHAARPSLAAMPLARLGEGEPPGLSELPLGTAPPGPAALPLLAAAPGGGGAVLAASPGDRAAYLYHAGMLLPSSRTPLKSGAPLAIVPRERGLREAAPGRYAAWIEAPAPGAYEFVLWRDRPASASCHALVIAGEAGQAAAGARLAPPPRVEASLPPAIAAGAPARIGLRLLDGEGRPLAPAPGDLAFLAMPAEPRSWQARGRAAPAAPGSAEATLEVTFPAPGDYRLLVRSASAGLRFEDGRPIAVRVTGPAAAGP